VKWRIVSPCLQKNSKTFHFGQEDKETEKGRNSPQIAQRGGAATKPEEESQEPAFSGSHGLSIRSPFFGNPGRYVT
jgi:hypothetical protein